MQVVWQDNIDPDQMTYEVSGFYNFSLFTGGYVLIDVAPRTFMIFQPFLVFLSFYS